MRPLFVRAASLAALGSLALANGCYSYLPAPAGPIDPERTTRLYLTTNGSAGVTRLLGPDVVTLDGHLTAATDTTFEVSVTSLGRQNGGADRWSGERVVIARTYVDHMTVRELDRTRTVVATLAALGGLLALRSAVGGTGDAVAGTPTGGTGPGQ